MKRCPHCGEQLFYHEDACPVCSRPLVGGPVSGGRGEPPEAANDGGHEPSFESDLGPTVPIARFSNAAEAGFFAHELSRREQVSAVVHVEEDFDALSGFWSVGFVLCVPEDDARHAAGALKRLVEESDAEAPEDYMAADSSLALAGGGEVSPRSAGIAAGFDVAPRSTAVPTALGEGVSGGVNWAPIVLTLTAGTAMLWGAHELWRQARQEPPARAGRQQDELWHMLSDPPGPWVQEAESGRRELRVDPRRRRATLREFSPAGRLQEEREFPLDEAR